MKVIHLLKPQPVGQLRNSAKQQKVDIEDKTYENKHMNIRRKEKLKETQYKILNQENTKFEGNTYMAI
jgi:hypothetical protein